MVTRSPFSGCSLKDAWLFLAAIVLVMLVFGQGGITAHSAPARQVDGGAVSTQVRAALLKQVGINAVGIGVEALGGRVELSGRVRSEGDRRKAEDAARAVAGVTSVSNRLVVR